MCNIILLQRIVKIKLGNNAGKSTNTCLILWQLQLLLLFGIYVLILLFWWPCLELTIFDLIGLSDTGTVSVRYFPFRISRLVKSWGGVGEKNKLFYIMFLLSLWSHLMRVTFYHSNLGASLYFQSLEFSVYV